MSAFYSKKFNNFVFLYFFIYKFSLLFWWYLFSNFGQIFNYLGLSCAMLIFCESVFLWGCLPVKSSSCEVLFLWVRLPGRLSSWKVVFLWGRLLVRSSYCEVVKGLVHIFSLNFKFQYCPGMGVGGGVVWSGEIKIKVSFIPAELELGVSLAILQEIDLYYGFPRPKCLLRHPCAIFSFPKCLIYIH